MAINGGSAIVHTPIGFLSNSGTLGAWVKLWLSKEPAFLSNGHVLSKVGADVHLNTTGGQIIGAVLDTRYPDQIDAGVGKCASDHAWDYATKDVGPDLTYRGFADPQHDEAVTMYGAVSKLGVADVNLNIDHIHYGARCFELLRWDDYPDWGVHGDSGTVILNSSEDIVGLYWGNFGDRRCAHYITDVARLLRLEPL
jgi:hypothetical protein